MTKVSSAADQQYITSFDEQADAAIVGAATAGAINSNEFIFAANFDGTGNTETNSPPANNKTTNVRQLSSEMAAADQTNVVARYYAGVGTPGMAFGSSFVPSQVTKQIVDTAESAYQDFVSAAASWLAKPGNSGKPVTAVVTAFSRGNGSAAVFSQMLFEQGLVIAGPNGGTIIAPPGKVGISAGVLFDPVTTGTDGNLAFAPNASNLVQIAAENEYRSSFERTDYSADTAVTSITMMGNHCDIGGGYDDGIADLSLEGARNFLINSGLPMGADARNFNQSDVYIHNEPTIYGLHWPQDAAFSDTTSLADEPARLIARRPAPASLQATGSSTTQSIVLQNGDTVKIITTSASTDESVEVDNESGSTTDTKHYRQNTDNTWAIADEVTGAILGSADDMVAIDNKNNDNIIVNLGNYKFDTLEVDAANGVNLKTSTVQVQALGSGSAVVLSGTSNKPVSSYKWVASDGTTYVFSRAAYADAAAGIGSLTVT